MSTATVAFAGYRATVDDAGTWTVDQVRHASIDREVKRALLETAFGPSWSPFEYIGNAPALRRAEAAAAAFGGTVTAHEPLESRPGRIY